MVKFIENKDKVKELTKKFYENELRLARNVVNVFNAGAVKRKLGRLVFVAVAELEAKEKFNEALKKGISAEGALTLWKKGYSPNPDGFWRAVGAAKIGVLEAGLCSDIFRLIGAIVEEAHKMGLRWGQVEMMQKEQRRPPAPTVPGLAINAPAASAQDRQAMVWGQKTPGQIALQERQIYQDLLSKGKPPHEAKRLASLAVQGEQQAFQDKHGLAGLDWQKNRQGKWVAPSENKQVYQGRIRGGIPKNQQKKDSESYKLRDYEAHFVHAWLRGMAFKEAQTSKEADEGMGQMHSVMGRMERMFGYPSKVMGADVSGTTADSTYVVERFTAAEDLDPILYLLPVGTIVGAGHHHLLEVAATLTLLGTSPRSRCKIGYKIGLYDTLLSEELKNSQYQTEVDKIKWYVRSATKDAPHILVYYKGGEPDGAVVLEKQDWEKVAELVPDGGASIWDCFLRVSQYPQLYDIRDLLRFRNCQQAWKDVQKKIAGPGPFPGR